MTYRERKIEDKYSYVASLSEVKDNAYNLNIPRYVETYESENTIDLEQISIKLQTLELEIQDNDLVIADFCKQLNISIPF